jgi:glycosyltransferase involved in cell wall biosynthesis
MRLLHVVPSYLPAWRHGGPIRAVHGLCAALVRRGHDVTVVTTDIDVPAYLPRSAAVDLDGVRVIYSPLSWPRRLYRSPALGRAAAEHVRRQDVVHLHSMFLWPTAVAARIARRAGVPYVLAPRGMLVRELVRRRGQLRKTLWLRLVERKTLAGAAALHATTALEAEEARRFGFALPPIEVVPNGVEDEPDDPTVPLAGPVAAALRRQPLVLFLGRLSWKKGLEPLVASLAHVPEATLAIAGGDDEGIRPRLETLAGEMGVGDRVVFTGPVGGVERIALLHRSAVLALTSCSENFGNSVLEAMAAGTAVLVTPGVGLAEEVRRSGAGLVADGQPAALGGALREILASDERRAAMGRAGRAAVAERYGWDEAAAGAERIYEQVVSPRRQRVVSGEGHLHGEKA